MEVGTKKFSCKLEWNNKKMDNISLLIFPVLLYFIYLVAKKRIVMIKSITAFAFLYLIPTIVFADETQLNIFENGSVADANEVNANFQMLEERLQEIEQSGSCSAQQDGSSVIITCPDGTSGVLASEGTILVYPVGVIGQVPVSQLPTGSFVVIDANDEVIAQLNTFGPDASGTLNGPIFRVSLLPSISDSYLININNDQSVLLTSPTNQPVFYPTADCSGIPYSKGHTVGWLRDLGSEGFYTLTSASPLYTFQAKSKRLTGSFEVSTFTYYPSEPCESINIAVNAGPLSVFEPATKVIQAAYPLRVEQLP